MGTSQSWVARMEAGDIDPGMSSLSRYLETLGAELDLKPVEASEFQPAAIADLARQVRRHPDDDETRLRLCLQFLDDFRDTTAQKRSALLSAPPRSTGDRRWDAFLAALAEHLAYHDGQPAPRWSGSRDRRLGTSWFVCDLPSVRAAALAESPAAFRGRGIFITEDFFARA